MCVLWPDLSLHFNNTSCRARSCIPNGVFFYTTSGALKYNLGFLCSDSSDASLTFS